MGGRPSKPIYRSSMLDHENIHPFDPSLDEAGAWQEAREAPSDDELHATEALAPAEEEERIEREPIAPEPPAPQGVPSSFLGWYLRDMARLPVLRPREEFEHA